MRNDERRMTKDERRTAYPEQSEGTNDGVDFCSLVVGRWSLVEDAHCVTCFDEALPARVLHVDQESRMALVAVKDTTTEVDISLVNEVAPGQLLLVHGGVAIAHLEEER